ncbi:MAG: right-handed parallel beta-helix repeat-containing protein, partial [Methanomassiliicoccaceae archaeon]|nr:right-handed parallel beta-helix repeat-containing protein [Methanomassiliicoccaceae archaeon]
IIEDCILHDSTNDTVKVKPNCNNITIRYNEIYNSGREYVGQSGFLLGECNSEAIDNVNGNNMKVQNNYIHDVCSNAIYAKGGAINSLIENNRIERAYGAGIMVGFDTSPQYFDTSVNPTYYENIGGIVRNNLIIHTGWEGIGFYGSKDAQVYNNTLVDVNYAQNYHSAIYFGLTYQDWESYAGRPATVNPNIHHNIVCQPAAFTDRPMIEIRYSNDLGGMSALSGKPTMNNNCFYIAGKNAVFVDNRPGSVFDGGLTGWISHIGGGSGSIEVDPALDAEYRPTNPQCAGMGCNFP